MQLRYYFPYSGEDIDRMHSAAQHFVGEHDFRNFCGPVCFDDVKRRWMTGEMLAQTSRNHNRIFLPYRYSSRWASKFFVNSSLGGFDVIGGQT